MIYSTYEAVDLCANGNFLDYEKVYESRVEDVYGFLDYRMAKTIAEECEYNFQKQRKNGSDR